jgi:thiamine biosynthesis lipoprotein
MTEFRVIRKLMGSRFELIVVETDADRAGTYLQAGIDEIIRLESLLTTFDEGSETSMINRFAGIRPVVVCNETYALLARCIQLSELTQGAFDITVGPLKKLYNFKNTEAVSPAPGKVLEALSKVGYQHVRLLENNKVFLSKRDMEIGFSAIGKGYAADCVKRIWVKMGVQNGVINASGDLTVLGCKADGQPWSVGIEDPDHPENLICHIPVYEGSVATSGDYEQYFMENGVRYGHTIDPKSGKPVTGIKSVTLVGPGAELCDALATAVYVMGVEVGMHFISQLPGTHCLIVDDHNKLFLSPDLNLVYASA